MNNGIFGWVGPPSKKADPELIYELTKQLAISVSRWRGDKYCGIATYEDDGFVRVYKDPISSKKMFSRDEDEDLKTNISTARIVMGNVGYDVPKDEAYMLPYKLKDGKWVLSMCGEIKNHDSISAICNKSLGDYPETSAMLIALEHNKDSIEAMRFIHSRVKGWFSLAALSLLNPSLILSRDNSSTLVVGEAPELGIYVYASTAYFIREAEEALGKKSGELIQKIHAIPAATYYKLTPGNISTTGRVDLDKIPQDIIQPKPLKFPNNEEYYIEIPIKRKEKICEVA